MISDQENQFIGDVSNYDNTLKLYGGFHSKNLSLFDEFLGFL